MLKDIRKDHGSLYHKVNERYFSSTASGATRGFGERYTDTESQNRPTEKEVKVLPKRPSRGVRSSRQARSQANAVDHPPAEGHEIRQTAHAVEHAERFGLRLVLLALPLPRVFELVTVEHRGRGFRLEVQEIEERGRERYRQCNLGCFAEHVRHGGEGEDLTTPSRGREEERRGGGTPRCFSAQ